MHLLALLYTLACPPYSLASPAYSLLALRLHLPALLYTFTCTLFAFGTHTSGPKDALSAHFPGIFLAQRTYKQAITDLALGLHLGLGTRTPAVQKHAWPTVHTRLALGYALWILCHTLGSSLAFSMPLDIWLGETGRHNQVITITNQ